MSVTFKLDRSSGNPIAIGNLSYKRASSSFGWGCTAGVIAEIIVTNIYFLFELTLTIRYFVQHPGSLMWDTVMVTNCAERMTANAAAAKDAIALREVFGKIDSQSCPQFYNFHMHTLYSDGRLEPEVLMEQALAIGLLGMAITDHHSIAGYKLAQQWFLQRQELQDTSLALQNLHLWTGVEITANLLDTQVHILGYAFDPDSSSIEPYIRGRSPKGDLAQALRVIKAIQEAGGVAVLAHPARYHLSPKDLVPAAADLGIDGVETYYAYNNPNPWEPSPKRTQLVKRLAEAHGLLSTCGTDTHGMDLGRRL
jgi:predicted metal-dependent phosphoesterase TrpH